MQVWPTVGRVILDSGHLELLSALTRHDTLAAASAAIHLSPSAASRRLQEAERRLGFQLATVDGRSMRLTAAGRIVAEAAAATDRQLSEAELAARWLGSGIERPLRIGVGFFDSIAWALADLGMQTFTITRIELHPTDRPLTNNEVDIVLDARQRCPDSNAVTVAEDQLALVVAATHPLAGKATARAADIAPFHYLGSALDPQPGFEFDAFFRPANTSPANITTVESLACILDLVATGGAVTIQPRRAVPERRDDLCVIPLDRHIPISWVAIAGPSPSDAAAEFLATQR